MELDHVFIFTQDPERLAGSLQAFGLTEGAPNVHSAQGTACRRFFFRNAYLELPWVVNEEEAKNAAIAKAKLWERSQSGVTGYCPFGLCFRVQDRDAGSENLLIRDGWRYYPDFVPEGQFIHIASNEKLPFEPMLFENPFYKIAPKDYPEEKQQPLTHSCGFRKITKVSLTLPAPMDNLSLAMRKAAQDSIVHVSEGKEYGIAVEFDDGLKGESRDFRPLASLTLIW